MEQEQGINEAFSDESLAEAEKYGGLGPQYFEARAVCERAMVSFSADHFKPLIDEFADAFRDKLWDSVKDSLLSDVEMNLQLEVARMVEGTVRALLTGKEWALRFYPLAQYHDGEKMREAIAKHIPDVIARKRIEELEARNKTLMDDLERAKRY